MASASRPKTLDDAERAQADRYGCLVRTATRNGKAPGLPSREIDHLPTAPPASAPSACRSTAPARATRIDTQGGLPQAARRPQRSEAGRPVVLDAAEFLAPLHGRPHRHLLASCRSTPDDTLLRTKWLVHKDAVEGEDYDLDNLTARVGGDEPPGRELVGIAQQGARQPGLRARALLAVHRGPGREVLRVVYRAACRPHLDPQLAR